MKEEHTRFTRSTDHSVSEMSEKLREMQKFFKLNVTGTLDAETLEVMKKPRCGVPDVAAYVHASGSYRWTKNELTYRYVSPCKVPRRSSQCVSCNNPIVLCFLTQVYL